ncbi:hypothetical protein DLJ54_09740 [Corynebacterium heidelbergense]|uniref:Uncharacterized protein n=1 Tax=Corynebacterium heidelbergense TaxID=2055947 RepID=A0A364V3G7_9CORY|nr:hypothetical protein DLJ54_09740 [Corynebacterium heidelbergense]
MYTLPSDGMVFDTGLSAVGAGILDPMLGSTPVFPPTREPRKYQRKGLDAKPPLFCSCSGWTPLHWPSSTRCWVCWSTHTWPQSTCCGGSG